jgi:sugar phosphate isomerase/epimerase
MGSHRDRFAEPWLRLRFEDQKMRIGFSSSLCSDWGIETIVQQAKAFGYDAVELQGLQGHNHLPACPAMADPAAVKSQFAAAGVHLACIGTECSFSWASRRTLADHKNRLRETLRLAAAVGCPCVCVQSGRVPAFHTHDKVLGRVVSALRELAPEAAERNVTILVENEGDLATSRDLWYLVDAAGHPAVRCHWNPCRALAAGDEHSLAVPRIGRMTSVVTLADAVFAAKSTPADYVPLGQGQADLARFLVLMHGIGCDADLIVGSVANPPKVDPTQVLPAALSWVKDQLTRIAQTPELSAYKGDKNAPRFVSRNLRATVNG